MTVVPVPSQTYAVCDAVASLTRSRIHVNGSFLLERPRAGQLMVGIRPDDQDPHTVTALVTCPSWGKTTLELTLCVSDGDWLAWGDFTIHYGDHMRPELSGKTIMRHLQPSFVTSTKGLPMRYRVRPRYRA